MLRIFSSPTNSLNLTGSLKQDVSTLQEQLLAQTGYWGRFASACGELMDVTDLTDLTDGLD